MPGVELSSNWKKLQASLKKDGPATGSRPGPKATGKTSASSLKRKRPAAIAPRPQPRTKMASSRVAPQSTSPPPPADTMPSITSPLSSSERNAGLITNVKAGRYLALDCEMVSTSLSTSRLARVSIVNYHLQTVYDSYVLPEAKDPVVDYRTQVSGIRPQDLRRGYARPLADVRQAVEALLSGRVLVGHALRNDLEALDMKHAGAATRDTARCPTFRELAGGRSPALRDLCRRVLGVTIQGAEHCSVVDARAAMELYKREKKTMEDEVRKRFRALIGRRGEGVLKGNGTNLTRDDQDAEPETDEDDDDVEVERVLLDGETDGEQILNGEEPGSAVVKKRKKKKRKHKRRTTRA